MIDVLELGALLRDYGSRDPVVVVLIRGEN